MYFVNGADKAEAYLLSPPVLAAALYLCHVLILSAAIKTRCVSLHGLAFALLAHDGHAASHRTNVNLSLTYGQSGGE